MNDLFSCGRNPGKIKKTKFNVRCNDVTQTQTESTTKVLHTQAEFKYKFVHTELVQVRSQ